MKKILGRRSFLATTGSAGLVLAGSKTAGLNRNDSGMHESYAAAERDGIKLGNRRFEITFDRRTGALVSLVNRHERGQVAVTPGAAPLRVQLGDRTGSVRHDLAISRETSRTVEHAISTSAEGTSLTLHWPDLSAGEERTGLVASCTFTVAPRESFVRIKTSLENRSSYWVTRLFLGLEGIRLNADASKENLLVGDVFGKPYSNPRENLKETKIYERIPAGQRTFGVPPTMPIGMVFSWMDLSDDRSGIGTGYLDHSELDLAGHVESTESGLDIGWRLFGLEGSKAFMWGYNGAQQVYPLAPGEQFLSDEWLLVLHHGDWHETALAYRSRYAEVFREDFLDWEKTAPAVKDCDIVLNSHIAWGEASKDRTKAYNYPNGQVHNRFSELPARVAGAMEKLGVRPGNVIFSALGTGTHWGIYKMPDHFPMCPEAGGQKDADEMCRSLRAKGVAGIMAYAHPYFLHREANNYLAAADTGLNYPHMDWHSSMGGIGCMAADEWQRLWAEKLFPEFTRTGVSGLYFDEGFGHQFICTKAEHSHGAGSLAVLSAQSRGATRLYRNWRKTAGNNAFLSCEGGSDMQARWIDLWHLPLVETLRFTHPDKMSMGGVDRKNIRSSVARALLLGAPLLIAPFPAPYPPELLEGEPLATLREFVELRQRLRDSGAPGYPSGFRDSRGLSLTPSEGVQAKLYEATTGFTVVYFTPQAFAGRVQIDTSRLGRKSGKLVRELKTKAGEMGFLIIKA